MVSTAFQLAESQYLELRNWLFDVAMPLWSSIGKDSERGGFFEKISKDLSPIEAPRRTRVVCRQIYSFGAASNMGWNGDVEEAVQHGWDFLARHCFSSDGTVAKTVDMESGKCEKQFDLYDHAFALFGLCTAARILHSERFEIERRAVQCLDGMIVGWKHPDAGFHEAAPPIEPLRSNPHMHILEASLSWSEIAGASTRGRWIELSDEIGELCLSKFISPETGAIREYYHQDWTVKTDETASPVEPGHQFEWAWLLARWGRASGRKDALAAARRLVEIGEEFGVAKQRDLVINGLGHDLKPYDAAHRLWPQTERIKAWLMMAELAVGHTDRNFALEKVAQAGKGLAVFLAEVPIGLWRDRLSEDGTTVDEPAPASSLYHIVCAIEEMHRCLDRPQVPRPALFLDRDGVIIEDCGYLSDVNDIRFINGAAETIQHFRNSGYYVFVVTNQSGIGRGYYDEHDYNLVRTKIAHTLEAKNAIIDAERASPYYAESLNSKYHRDPDWRKPNPGMILNLAEEWKIDIQNSILVGDKVTDLEAAKSAGLAGVLFTHGNLYEFLSHKNLLP